MPIQFHDDDGETHPSALLLFQEWTMSSPLDPQGYSHHPGEVDGALDGNPVAMH